MSSTLEKIGKYPVIRKLGEGATSSVYLCEDPFNRRQVAVKRVHPEALKDNELADDRVFADFFESG